MKRNIGKILALLLCAAMLCGCGNTAKTGDGSGKPGTEDASGTQADAHMLSPTEIPSLGISFQFPEKYKDMKGMLAFNGGMLKSRAGVGFLELEYLGVAVEDFEAFNEHTAKVLEARDRGQELPEEPRKGWNDHNSLLAPTFCIGLIKGTASEPLTEVFKDCKTFGDTVIDSVQEIGKAGEYTFYLLHYPDSVREGYREKLGDLYDDYAAFCADPDTFTAALTFTEPVEQQQDTGSDGRVVFTADDFDGKATTSGELFAGHKVTMINIWATECEPSLNELAELGKLAKEFEEKDCQIIGICLDANTPDGLEKAKQLLEVNGCTYTNLIDTSQVTQSTLYAQGVPASFFVDSQGKQLITPIVGSQPEQYPLAIDACLSLLGE